MNTGRPANTSQENLLYDYVERLETHRTNRRAVHVRLSRIQPFNRRETHLRTAADTFDALEANLQGQLFELQNRDLFFVFKSSAQGKTEDAVDKLHFLFGDDPLLINLDKAGLEGGFCDWYNVATQYDQVLELVRQWVEDEKAAKKAVETATGADGRTALLAKQGGGESLSPRMLARVEDALKRADLTSMVRRQYVCRIDAGEPPEQLFSELFISVRDLRETMLPTVNLASSRWLFQHLTETLDRRVLSMLTKTTAKDLSGELSINLNVSTLMSQDFLDFDDKIIAGQRGGIIIELHSMDVFADLSAYMFTREFVRDRGYRIAIDGLTAETLPFADRERLGCDLLKLLWSPTILDAAPQVLETMRQSIARAGPDHVVLCRCDDQDAVNAGWALGVRIFQGRHVENLIAEENRKRNVRYRRFRR